MTEEVKRAVKRERERIARMVKRGRREWTYSHEPENLIAEAIRTGE